MKNNVIQADEAQKNAAEISDVIGNSAETNRYYGSVSFVYRLVEFAFLAIFLLFLLFSALGNAGKVSYANLEYIFRNFAMKLDENNEKATEIIYNPDSSVSYSVFGNGFAVCGNSGITVFSATGRRTCSFSLDLDDPVMRASDKYILVFDNGRNRYYLFNMFSKLLERDTEYPVRGACIADNGCYAIITGTEGYNSCVEVYDSDFNLRSRISKNGYVVCADFDADGKKIAVATVNMNPDGTYVTELTVNTVGSTVTDASCTIQGDFPLAVKYADGHICAVCSDGFYSFGESLELLVSRGYGDRELSDLALSDSAVCLVLENSSEALNRTRTCEILDFTGSSVGSYETRDLIGSVHLYENSAYLLTGETPVLVSGNSTKTLTLPGSIRPEKVLAYADGKIYVCCRSAAYVMDFDAED